MEYIILIVSLVGIVLGADYLVNGSVAIAKRYKVSDFVIGAAIVGIGTSLPEFVVSTIGAIQGNAEVAIGNVVGSNIFNVLAILGLTAIFFPIPVDKNNLKFEIPLCVIASILLIVLVFNFFTGGEAVIGRVDGVILLVIFFFYMWNSFRRDAKNKLANPAPAAEESKDEKIDSLGLALVKVVGGLGVLITGCHFFVEEAIVIARNFGASDAFISITLIACGTSLPELAASVTAALKKNTQLALGNIVGSNIFNICLILGVGSEVMPLKTGGITFIDYAVMLAAVLMTVYFGFRGKISRVGGAVLFIGYIAYTWYLTSNL